MGIDNMRGGYGRCPPLLAGGLFVMCVILVFNWWSLSSQNYELLKQLQDLSEQLKISSDEQDLCVRQKQALETRNKLTQDDLAKSRVRIELVVKENDDIKKTLEAKEEELRTSLKNKEEVQGNADRCNTELDSLKKLDLSKDGTMASLRLDKDRVTAELKELRQQVQKLHTDLENAQAELAGAKNHKEESIPSAVKDPSEQPVTLPDNIIVGGDHELEVEENNNNAKEERDEPDAPADLNGETNQIVEPEQRMEVEEEEVAPA